MPGNSMMHLKNHKITRSYKHVPLPNCLDAPSLNSLAQVDNFRHQNNDPYRSDLSFWPKLEFKTKLKISELTPFTSILQGVSSSSINNFTCWSILAVVLKQASYNLLQILCAMLFFKRNCYSDSFYFPWGQRSLHIVTCDEALEAVIVYVLYLLCI